MCIFGVTLSRVAADLTLCGGDGPVGNAAGAAHLLNCNVHVLRSGEENRSDQTGKSLLDFEISTNTNCETMAYRILWSETYSVGSIRKGSTNM